MMSYFHYGDRVTGIGVRYPCSGTVIDVYDCLYLYTVMGDAGDEFIAQDDSKWQHEHCTCKFVWSGDVHGRPDVPAYQVKVSDDCYHCQQLQTGSTDYLRSLASVC